MLPAPNSYLAIVGKGIKDVIGACRFEGIADNEREEPGSGYIVISKDEYDSFMDGWGNGPLNAKRQEILKRPWLRANKRVIYNLVVW